MEIVSRNIGMVLGSFGIIIIIIGLYLSINAKKDGYKDVFSLGMFFILVGLFFFGMTPVNNFYLINHVVNNKNNLISVNAEDTNNEKVIMKFKESDDSIKVIKAPVKEKIIKDKRKHNKYSLKYIKDGYVIYYITENVDIPSNPTLKYFNGKKPLENVVKE